MFKPHHLEFLRFCIVGFVGFVADAGALEMFVHLGAPTLLARVFSIFFALQVTYYLHGAFTFRDHQGYSFRSWLTFLTSNGIGAAINYGIFTALLFLLPIENPVLHRQLALLGGTAVALFFNYWANRRFVFKKE